MSSTAFQYMPFSQRQRQALSWWLPNSPHYNKVMLICEGAVRSGKTIAALDSFLMWSLYAHRNQNFIIAGKSIGALRRNIVQPMKEILKAKGIPFNYQISTNVFLIGSNTYYLFGAPTQASQDVLQGLTAAGCFLDEATLLPRNFIDQSLARCSVENSKYFLTLNPESPLHHMKTDFIDRAHELNALVLHFDLDDNLSLSQEAKSRLKSMFSGVFFERYILGLWSMADGLVYPGFDHASMIVSELPKMVNYWIGVDYGHSNPTVFILTGLGIDGRFYIINEYYHSGKESTTRSPSQYSQDFIRWQTDLNIEPERIFIDPSAKGFITQLHHDGIRKIAKAGNSVLPGISKVSSLISMDKLRVHSSCTHTLKEFSTYSWDSKAQLTGTDRPSKQNDHVMDAIRYVATGASKHLFK